MISNRLLQESLEDFKEIVRLPMALYDRNCTCVAGAENMAPEKEGFQTFCNSSADMQALGNRYLFRVGDGESGYILSVEMRRTHIRWEDWRFVSWRESWRSVTAEKIGISSFIIFCWII